MSDASQGKSSQDFPPSDNVQEMITGTDGKNLKSASPIVVLDSGLGGLTVVRAMRRVMPEEDIAYFGDTARLPYGSKTATTVTMFVRQIIQYLLPLNPKHVVIACNTATALALSAVRQMFPQLTITGVIEPGARAAVQAAGSAQSPVIGVMATEATIRSRAYERAIVRRRHYARLLLMSAPLLVPIIEEGRPLDDPLVKLALKQYLSPLIRRNLNVLVLGCTHYPLLRPLVEQMVGPAVAVIDSADQCAQDVAARLAVAKLRRPAGRTGHLESYVTDNSPRFGELASTFLGFEIDAAHLVSPEELTLIPEGALRKAV